MTIKQLMRQIIAKQDEIIEHYKTFYDSIKHPLVVKITKRWEEYGNEIESELADLNKQLKQSEVESEVAEIKSTPIPSGWICPRCQKVHNWMVQSCDCYPSVITASTTEPKEVAENKVCIHRDGRLCSNANSDYLRCPGECSEAEYPI